MGVRPWNRSLRRCGLILLDLTMPMDGFAFIAELRQREDWRTIPIVVMTAKDLTPEERQWLHGSVAKVLQKGAYSRADLLGEVRRLAASCAPGNGAAGAQGPGAAPSQEE